MLLPHPNTDTSVWNTGETGDTYNYLFGPKFADYIVAY